MRPSDKVFHAEQAIGHMNSYARGNYEAQYLRRLYDLRIKAWHQGEAKADRTGVGRFSILGGYLSHDTGEYGPAFFLSKKVFPNSVFQELAWFLRGETNNNELRKRGVSIWDEWADEDGALGPIYGAQWRGIDERDNDQIMDMLNRARRSPADSGNLLSSWNVEVLPDMALRPCHTMFQICIQDGKLDLMLYQRSADWFLGVPFNAASYTSLQILFAHMLGLKPGIFHHYFGDTHLYANQMKPADEHLERLSSNSAMIPALSLRIAAGGAPERHPTLTFSDRFILREDATRDTLKDIEGTDFILQNYVPEPPIKAERAAV